MIKLRTLGRGGKSILCYAHKLKLITGLSKKLEEGGRKVETQTYGNTRTQPQISGFENVGRRPEQRKVGGLEKLLRQQDILSPSDPRKNTTLSIA